MTCNPKGNLHLAPHPNGASGGFEEPPAGTHSYLAPASNLQAACTPVFSLFYKGLRR